MQQQSKKPWITGGYKAQVEGSTTIRYSNSSMPLIIPQRKSMSCPGDGCPEVMVAVRYLKMAGQLGDYTLLLWFGTDRQAHC
jgi:hypothetical protein